MDSRPNRRAVKVGVRRGTGLPPGYFWNVSMLPQSLDDSHSLLNLNEREHMRLQVLELARYPIPLSCPTVDVKPIEDFFEIRDKGGILGKKNVRLFFCVDEPRITLVTLGLILKKNEGQTQQYVKINMRNRKRNYEDLLRQP